MNYHNKDKKVQNIKEKKIFVSKLHHDIDLRPTKTTVLSQFFVDDILEIGSSFRTVL